MTQEIYSDTKDVIFLLDLALSEGIDVDNKEVFRCDECKQLFIGDKELVNSNKLDCSNH